MQRDVAARRDLHRSVDLDGAAGVGLDAAQVLRVEPAGVQVGLADQVFGQRVFAQEIAGAGAAGADMDGLQQRRGIVAQLRAGGVIYRRQLAQHQLAVAGGGQLRLTITVEAGIARVLLALALEYARFDRAFQHGRCGSHHHAARVTAHGIAVFQPLLGADQGIGEIFRRFRAPALVVRGVALVHARIQHVAGRGRQPVQLAILAAEPALANHARLDVKSAAGHVEQRAGLGHQFTALESHRAALCRPLADAMAAGVQITAHFEQAAARVPAVGRIAIRACRHPHQVAPVDPQVGAVEGLAVAVAGRVALLVALCIDQHVVRSHRHVDAHGAGDVDAGAARHLRAARGQRIDLAAGGQRQRTGIEGDIAAGGNLDQRQVAAVVGAVARQRRILDERVALHVQRGGAAVVEQHRGKAVRRQGDQAFAAVGLQVHGAACRHAGAAEQHAGLLHVAARQGDVAGKRLHQAAIRHLAGAALRIELDVDLVATRARSLVGIRPQALADDEAVAGGQRHLTVRRGQAAAVMHFAPGQQHIAAAFRHRLRLARADLRASLHHHVGRGVGVRGHAAVEHQIVGQRGLEARALRFAVDALTELAVAHAHGGGHQTARVDLAAARKHDAIAVDQHHRAVSLDLAADLAGTGQRIVDAVEYGPVRQLVKLQGGILADIERFPVQDRLVGRLLDGHHGLAVGLRLRGAIRVEPARRQAVAVDLQAAFGQAFRHLRAGGNGRLARRLLGRLLHGDGACGQLQIVQRTLQLCIGFLLLRLLIVRPDDGLAIRQASRGGGRALLRTLAGKPGTAEWLLRLRAARLQQHGDGQRQRFQSHRATNPVARHGGGGCVFRDRLASLHGDIPFSCSVADRYREAARGTHGAGGRH
ncbi:hypothetical protein JANLI_58490 [Janthinobacterium lividum]|nr:hypothetical protein JANLI_58490 [Janthinobacterium lividum]